MNNLTKYLLLAFLCLACTNTAFGQLGLQLRPGFNEERCPGYEEENLVMIDVVNMPPLTPAPGTNIEYYWIITHEEGEWVYQTDNNARPFRLTFHGEYSMRCRVLYVSQETTFAYASFWSSPLIIETGENCE